MSYESPRKAVLLTPIIAKIVGSGGLTKLYRRGTKVQVQRNPAKAAMFIIWISRSHVAEVSASDLLATIRYTDGRQQL